MRISPPAGPLPGVCKAPATRLSYWQRARDAVTRLQTHYGRTPVCICIALCLVLFVGAGYQIGNGLRVIAKAHLAQLLIQHAWQENTTSGEASIKPWPWADMAPIARITFERQQTALFVLDNDAPRTLAFGPGLNPQSALPGHGARSVVSAHRDTHFAVLEHVVPGDIVRVETLEGRTLRYEIKARQIVDEHDLWVLNNHGRDELTMVTCWPFNALVPRGPDRLIVTAERLLERIDS
ncbi:MAG: class GN sortase [Burkholderiaceae bacterium]